MSSVLKRFHSCPTSDSGGERSRAKRWGQSRAPCKPCADGKGSGYRGERARHLRFTSKDQQSPLHVGGARKNTLGREGTKLSPFTGEGVVSAPGKPKESAKSDGKQSVRGRSDKVWSRSGTLGVRPTGNQAQGLRSSAGPPRRRGRPRLDHLPDAETAPPEAPPTDVPAPGLPSRLP